VISSGVAMEQIERLEQFEHVELFKYLNVERELSGTPNQ
jgi:hypothetical protein